MWRCTSLILTVLALHSSSGAPRAGEVENGLVITSPSAGAIVRPGDVLNVTVEPQGGFAPQRLVVGAAPYAEQLFVEGPYDEPVTAALQIPCNAGPGVITLLAFGTDAASRVSRAEDVTLDLEVVGNLTRLYAWRDLTFLDDTPPQRLRVYGEYDDCLEPRDLTAACTGTVFASEDAAVAAVDSEGEVTAIGVGNTRILIRHGEKVAYAVVDVKGVWTHAADE